MICLVLTDAYYLDRLAVWRWGVPGVIVVSRTRKIRQYFPDFPRVWAKP